MKTIRTPFAVLAGTVMAGTLLLAGCMSSQSLTHEQRLAVYQAHAGAPVKKIPYFNPIGWEEIDDQLRAKEDDEMLAEGSVITQAWRYDLAGTYSMLTDGLMRYVTRRREGR